MRCGVEGGCWESLGKIPLEVVSSKLRAQLGAGCLLDQGCLLCGSGFRTDSIWCWRMAWSLSAHLEDCVLLAVGISDEHGCCWAGPLIHVPACLINQRGQREAGFLFCLLNQTGIRCPSSASRIYSLLEGIRKGRGRVQCLWELRQGRSCEPGTCVWAQWL